jgi:hypothetical protein
VIKWSLTAACCAVLLVWAWSLCRNMAVTLDNGRAWWTFATGGSSLSIKYGHNPYLTSDRWRFTSQHEPHLDGQPWWRWLPSFGRDPDFKRMTIYRLVVPLYIPFVLLSLPTAYLWLRRRVPPGSCRRCAYSLANLPPGAQCPECGAKPEVSA